MLQPEYSSALNCEPGLYLVDHNSVSSCLLWLIPNWSNHRVCSSLKRGKKKKNRANDGVMSGGLKKKRGKDNHLDPLWGNFIPLALQTWDPQFPRCLLWGYLSIKQGRNICLRASVIVEFQELLFTSRSRHPLTTQNLFSGATSCRIRGPDINFTGFFFFLITYGKTWAESFLIDGGV